jgi:hypothetical protein
MALQVAFETHAQRPLHQGCDVLGLEWRSGQPSATS